MTTGLTFKKEVAPKQDESFQPPRPPLIETKDQARLKEVYLPPEVNHTPAAPVIDHVVSTIKSKGNERLAELIALATIKAKQAARSEENEKLGYPSARSNKVESKSNSAYKKSDQVILYTDADKCDDETFIKRTMDANLHDAEMKRLFYCNGGQAYIDAGMVYGAAYTMLRSSKMTSIRAKTRSIIVDDQPWLRASAPPKDSKVYIAGVPTVSQLIARQHATEDAIVRERNELWMRGEQNGRHRKQAERDVNQEVH